MPKQSNRGRSRGAAQAPKSLFRRVERTLDAIEHGETPLGTISNVADYMAVNFCEDLGITGGRIYKYSDTDDYELVATFGTASASAVGRRVARDYPAFEALVDAGLVVMDRDAPGLDPDVEESVGSGERFAALSIADGGYVIAFDVAPGRGVPEDLRASLNIIRLAINQKLRQERFDEILEDARRIQSSILPKRVPSYADFDIAGDSRPAEIVGGDFYDYIPITPEIFDLVIADASGHGLPAALQVRDIYVGLRMGLTRDYKVSRTVERLNAIINRSKLASKFVSLFVAELETNGNLIYTNAGHVPPFILHAGGGIEVLPAGGMVLGPSPDATYHRGFAHMGPGDILVLYTDGLTECFHHRTGEEFGEERLQRLVRRNSGRSAAEIVQEVFRAMSRFAGTPIPTDDQTIVVVRRPGASDDGSLTG